MKSKRHIGNDAGIKKNWNRLTALKLSVEKLEGA